MRTSRFAASLAQQDAERQATEPESNGQAAQEHLKVARGPRYVAHRPLWKKLVGKGSGGGCSSCHGEPWGWVQRQITTPRRTVRLLAWLVTLLPRGWELARVLASKRTDDATCIDRQTACGECEACVVVVREKPGDFVIRDVDGNPRHPNFVAERRMFTEHAYCGACQCPEWPLARLTYKNRKAAWECPRHLHAGPYRGDAVRAEIARRQTEWREAHTSVPLPIVGSGNGGN